MRVKRVGATAALLGTGAALASIAGGGVAAGADNPGQALFNDYGQSPAEVAAEVRAAVVTVPTVIRATSAVSARHAAVLPRVTAERTAYTAYVAAVRSRNATRIAATRNAYLAARALALRARMAEAAARAALGKATATATAAVRAQHYLPVDGVWTGAVSQYFIPGLGLEPIQVQITVYGGHVSDISVPQYVSTGDSGSYNARALPVLMEEAMAARDTAVVAAVTGASLTSGSFATSLQSALTKAGFK